MGSSPVAQYSSAWRFDCDVSCPVRRIDLPSTNASRPPHVESGRCCPSMRTRYFLSPAVNGLSSVVTVCQPMTVFSFTARAAGEFMRDAGHARSVRITPLDVTGPTPVFDRGPSGLRTKVSLPLEELHGALVFLRRRARFEGAEVAALAA